MRLSYDNIYKEKVFWDERNIIVPNYDTKVIKENTRKNPQWLHFGGGNIFRGYIACLADTLIEEGIMDTGIIATDSFDDEIFEKVYQPYDNLTLLVGLRRSGDKYLRVIGSVVDAVSAVGEKQKDLAEIAVKPSLQMISFTITEKGYAIRGLDRGILPMVEADIKAGPQNIQLSAMGVVTSLLYKRFKNGMLPIALVSMDNCSENGKKLQEAVHFIAEEWKKLGFVEDEFITYLSDKSKVSFPWSMIDKITPRPDPEITKELSEMGIEDMEPVLTSKKTFIAPFVNAEMPQYLVIEDDFPNGRPDLAKAGIYLTDRETVNRVERMKVMTCLNPLHTALAIFGCLLGFKKISDEMKDVDLRMMVERLGVKEGLPVVTNPGIIDPKKFLDEVMTERLPNSFLPDTPQRIATDTSQKVSIRFGETIKVYDEKGRTGELKVIPLVIAAWLRYLIAVDDFGEVMELSSDPMLNELRRRLNGIKIGTDIFAEENFGLLSNVREILGNSKLFGVDLVANGMNELIEERFNYMIGNIGRVRSALHETVIMK